MALYVGPRFAAKVALCVWLALLFVSYFVVSDAHRDACSDISPVCVDMQARCTEPRHRHLLRLTCPVTCGACDAPLPTAADFDCRDSRDECSSIAAADRCDARPLTFWRDCPESCRVGCA